MGKKIKGNNTSQRGKKIINILQFLKEYVTEIWIKIFKIISKFNALNYFITIWWSIGQKGRRLLLPNHAIHVHISKYVFDYFYQIIYHNTKVSIKMWSTV